LYSIEFIDKIKIDDPGAISYTVYVSLNLLVVFFLLLMADTVVDLKTRSSAIGVSIATWQWALFSSFHLEENYGIE
jgi:hypothetical protein